VVTFCTSGTDDGIVYRMPDFVCYVLPCSHCHAHTQRVNTDSDDGLKGAVEVLITEVFGETERSLSKVCIAQAAASSSFSAHNHL
jgi:hypothetical protein